MRLEIRVAIVTGGAPRGAGQGASPTGGLCEGRAPTVIIATSPAPVPRRTAGIQAAGGKALAIKCDVTSADQVRDMVAATVAAFGKIDILVNNAGSLLGVPGATNLATVTEEAWECVLNLNLKGAFLCSREVVPYMQANGTARITTCPRWRDPPPCPPRTTNSAKPGCWA